jgi:hypothetical protein
VTKPKEGVDPALEKAVKDMLKASTTSSDFEQKAKAIEIAMKFEALKLKAKGPRFGKGFDSDEGGDDEGDEF